MTTKHTPGPWRTGGLPQHAPIVYAPDDYAICDTKTFHGRRSPEEAEANARLIAAAPDMLAALQAFREWHANNFGDFSHDLNAQLLSLDNDAVAAIAKAEGRA